ncbi:hypothetical protein [Streptomyces lavendulae]|uniref:hypothetical protein n=1 Tax=Streptomyces lavendulae TaxID=1914 RepID=UPI0024A0CB89|nr:hypothetical protein [Streptomyces lavendulae]GLX22640.1 hypothetical protein Slala01_62840 [Streptomyces lavendulae subsp. lavendulae]GLX30123.1 hypothetical protein Slala02_59430 [Streptomyces lavendulae subsp. lavendulae]
MSVTTFDQHVNEALALIAPARRPVTASRPARSAGAPQHGRPRLVRLPSSREGGWK